MCVASAARGSAPVSFGGRAVHVDLANIIESVKPQVTGPYVSTTFKFRYLLIGVKQHNNRQPTSQHKGCIVVGNVQRIYIHGTSELLLLLRYVCIQVLAR